MRRACSSISSSDTRSGLSLTPLLLVLAVLGFANADVNLSPAGTSGQASGVSNILRPSYIGFGIEPSNMFSFVGRSSANQLTNNLISNLASYTGVPPHVRIGGNTQDTAIYNSQYSGYDFSKNPNYSGPASEYQFGPNFFKAINNLPAKTPISLGIGMTYQGNDAINMSVAIARQAVSALTNVDLVALEVGNEPDLYIVNGFRQSGWSVNDYGNEWIARVDAIYNQVLKPANIGSAFFEAACTATTANYPDYRISNLVKTGVGRNNGVYLAGWNQHDYYYYVGVTGYQLTTSALLDLSTTTNQFTEWASQAGQAAVTGKPYYLREMGSVGPAGIQGISNTFANCLWSLNFFLYAATVAVDAVQIHMLQSSYGSPWQPITDPQNQATFVRPSYYAFAAMSQIIGAKCATTVAPISLSNAPSYYNNRLGAYVVYDNSNLQSLVLLNTQMASSSSGNNIGGQNFVIKLPTSLAGRRFYLSTLTAGGADSTSNVTWNGMSYEQSGDGSPTMVSSGNTPSSVVGQDGTLTVYVRDSQAVVANLNSQLGTQNNVVDTAACNALAASTAEGSATSTTTGKGAAPTFKATSGFASGLALSTTAIIGIAAGGGVALLILLGLLIWCCVRRSRRKKEQKALDAAALLPPGKMNRYANVSQRDSLDTATANDDIWMLPMDGKRTRYDSASGYSTPRKFGSHSRQASQNTSINGSPLMPASPLMGSPSLQDLPMENQRFLPPSAAAAAAMAAKKRQSYQPHVPSNLAHATNGSNQMRDNASLGIYPGFPPTGQYEDMTQVPRGRHQSTPDRRAAEAAVMQRPSRRSADMSSQPRAPSVPGQRTNSGRPREPSPYGATRLTQSSHGHGSHRQYMDAPPVPPMPSSYSHGHDDYQQSELAYRSAQPQQIPSMPAAYSHPTQPQGAVRQPSPAPVRTTYHLPTEQSYPTYDAR